MGEIDDILADLTTIKAAVEQERNTGFAIPTYLLRIFDRRHRQHEEETAETKLRDAQQRAKRLCTRGNVRTRTQVEKCGKMVSDGVDAAN